MSYDLDFEQELVAAAEKIRELQQGGYREAYRLMWMAGKFNRPLVCLIDTTGAFPGLADEERGQSGGIAANLLLMSRVRVPIVSVVIGEGGSGGALALSVADRLLML